ncbi:hypothetical protein [Rhodovulum euryhalinum]|uniref:Uncharacterized protein n=1 Tax=Rhodovulum euryhalinum TaxID=35805 RepID=A0A4R2KIS4_9RHOB|nr:hypothetical protein [Rhodovulum euryhalinum]TCO72392.1 hypothetical protein EV655_10479 [Rhodovulum euryhalinum]
MHKVANREALDGVQQMHRALHMALDALVNHDDPARAVEILSGIDAAMVDWINETRKMR